MKNVTLTAVIIEDEHESLQLLESLIKADGTARIIGTTSDPYDALNLIIKLDPDIVFLDVKMPGRNGFEILDKLIKVKSRNPYIIFTTAYDEFAVRAFEYAAFDYLLKPVEPDRLASTIMRCREAKLSGSSQKAELLIDILCRFDGIVQVLQ